MVKVRVNTAGASEAPAAAGSAQADTGPALIDANTAAITDALGRRIKVRRLQPLDRFRLLRLIGEQTKNDAYLGYAAYAYAVAELDGERYPPSTSVVQLEAMLQKLGDEGFAAVAIAMAELSVNQPPPMEPAAIKN